MVGPEGHPATALTGVSARAGQASVRWQGLDRALALVAGLALVSQLLVGTLLPILPLFAIALGATPGLLGTDCREECHALCW